ncbi:hypothetical protein [Actinomadura sp. DC4]|uniref:hypothetical protein n=1 Tax=Actinomadura sp. DC4 TaxID=3055069 RepID=UPI0025B1B352|nr:hypothetical protein [Actinomadura sp. DC4]MDN3353324.1 hypothetical protein [Actinomadura sp. DC4]
MDDDEPIGVERVGAAPREVERPIDHRAGAGPVEVPPEPADEGGELDGLPLFRAHTVRHAPEITDGPSSPQNRFPGSRSPDLRVRDRCPCGWITHPYRSAKIDA